MFFGFGFGFLSPSTTTVSRGFYDELVKIQQAIVDIQSDSIFLAIQKYKTEHIIPIRKERAALEEKIESKKRELSQTVNANHHAYCRSFEQYKTTSEYQDTMRAIAATKSSLKDSLVPLSEFIERHSFQETLDRLETLKKWESIKTKQYELARNPTRENQKQRDDLADDESILLGEINTDMIRRIWAATKITP